VHVLSYDFYVSLVFSGECLDHYAFRICTFSLRKIVLVSAWVLTESAVPHMLRKQFLWNDVYASDGD